MWSIFPKKNQLPVDGRTVLITGASQGMGLAAARLLSSKGASIIIVARDEKKLASAIEQIAAAARHPTQRFHTISTDITSAAANDRILAEATSWNNNTPPDIIWAIAGSSTPSLFLDASPETLRSQMDVNYFSVAYLAQSALRAWLAHPTSPVTTSITNPGSPPSETERARHFIMTTSIGALLPLAGYAPYAPAKAALRSLWDQLTQEVLLYNGAFSTLPSPQPPSMKIHIVFPGSIDSPGLAQENKTKHAVTKMLEEVDDVQSPEEAAKGAWEGLQKGHSMVTTQVFMGEIIKGSAWQGSRRDQPVLNTLTGWLTSLVWLYVGWEMAGKVWKWGVKEGVPSHEGVNVGGEGNRMRKVELTKENGSVRSEALGGTPT